MGCSSKPRARKYSPEDLPQLGSPAICICVCLCDMSRRQGCLQAGLLVTMLNTLLLLFRVSGPL